MILTNLFKYLCYVIQPKAGVADITIVRRYPDATGSYIGEIYVEGRCLGNSCDKFIEPVEFVKQPISRGINCLYNSIYKIEQEDFIKGSREDVCYIDCIKELLEKTNGIKELRLTVLNRLLIER